MPTLELVHLKTIKEKYYTEQLSMGEIAKQLDVSIDAVLYFMRRHNLKRRTYIENAAVKFSRKDLSYSLVSTMTPEQEILKQAAVVIYWCEGGKANSLNGIDLANSDSKMVLIFLRFLREVCRVDESRLRIYLYCYSNQSPDELIGYWSLVTQIPKEQFSKPYVRHDFNPGKTGKMSKGMVHIRYSDKKLWLQMLRWIEEYKEKLAPIV